MKQIIAKSLLFFLLTLISFDLLLRLLGRDNFYYLWSLVHTPPSRVETPAVSRYKEWFAKNYDQSAVEDWKIKWNAAKGAELSKELRYMPPIEGRGVTFVYLPGPHNFRLKRTNGDLVYEALVNIEDDGYRRTILPKSTKKDETFVLIGDSYTFGYGLNDDETFASQFAKMNGADVKNLGIINTGPNDLLRAFRDTEKLKLPEIKSKKIKIIYTYDSEYYARAYMSSSFVEEGVHNYYNDKPIYREENGKLKFIGTFNQQTLTVAKYKLYNLTALNQTLKIELPTSYEEYNPEFALIFKELKDYFKMSYPNSEVEFYFAAFPLIEEYASPDLIQRIESHGIKIIHLEDKMLDDILPEDVRYLPADMHPSPMSAFLYAKMLSDYFKDTK